ncbi:MAG: thiamine-phosphate pyrophosphorylase [Candidatus Omnitrophota bacterium]
MSKFTDKRSIYRIIDANINRLKEGLRVSEEITRFILDNRTLTKALKDIRHRVDALAKALPPKKLLVACRCSCEDIGRTLTNKGEITRKNLSDIFFANIQRAKESVRVLEEFTKLEDPKVSRSFKDIRYRIYELEKNVTKKIAALRNR